MLFLFNKTVLDIGDPATALARLDAPISVDEARRMSPDAVRAVVKEAAFANPKFDTQDPDKAAAVAAMIHLRSGANAAVALMRQGGTGPQHVYLRFTVVSEVVMKHLADLQEQGWLTFAAVEVAVWTTAA